MNMDHRYIKSNVLAFVYMVLLVNIIYPLISIPLIFFIHALTRFSMFRIFLSARNDTAQSLAVTISAIITYLLLIWSLKKIFKDAPIGKAIKVYGVLGTILNAITIVLITVDVDKDTYAYGALCLLMFHVVLVLTAEQYFGHSPQIVSSEETLRTAIEVPNNSDDQCVLDDTAKSNNFENVKVCIDVNGIGHKNPRKKKESMLISNVWGIVFIYLIIFLFASTLTLWKQCERLKSDAKNYERQYDDLSDQYSKLEEELDSAINKNDELQEEASNQYESGYGKGLRDAGDRQYKYGYYDGYNDGYNDGYDDCANGY